MISEMFVMKLCFDDKTNNERKSILNKIFGIVRKQQVMLKVNERRSKRSYYKYQSGLLNSIPYHKVAKDVFIIKHKFPVGKDLSSVIKFYIVKNELFPVDLNKMMNGYERAVIKSILLGVPVKNINTDDVCALCAYDEKVLSRGILK